MSKRKGISASVRWSVFARDDFRCRYCGAQAGQDGTELVIDHIVSVADGGDNRIDNLLTACQRCNGGKGARSLEHSPVDAVAVDRVNDQAKRRMEFAEAQRSIVRALEDQKAARQQLVDLGIEAKCDAYGQDTVKWAKSEGATIANMIEHVGIEKVREWYQSAANNGVPQDRAIMYVCGCRRHYLDERERTGE